MAKPAKSMACVSYARRLPGSPTPLVSKSLAREKSVCNLWYIDTGWSDLMMRTLILVLATLAISSHDLYARCECPGRRINYLKGGDGAPLFWSYSAYLVQEGQPNSAPLICYSRFVANNSTAKVLNVRWDVAGYVRRSIPRNDSNDSCPTLEGEIDPTLRSGPLHHGISS